MSRERTDAFKEVAATLHYARCQGEQDLRQVQHWINEVEKFGFKKFIRGREDG
jgi:hypothetical protein